MPASEVQLEVPALMDSGATSASGLGNHVSALKSQGATQAALAFEKLGKALTRIENLLRTGGQVSLTAEQVASLLPTVTQSLVYRVTLSASTTNITYADPTTEGDQLTVFIKQPGSKLITWGSNLLFATTEIRPTASYNVFHFVAMTDFRDGILRWFCTGLPIIGQTLP